MLTNTADERIIGVIGGMGPYAGLDLVQKIFDETLAASDQAHLPVTLLSFPARISDRTRYMLYADVPDPAPEIARIALQLENTGAVIAGMPCNSAHAPPIYDRIQQALRQAGSNLRLLNMIDETAVHLRSEFGAFTRIGVLSTNSIFQLGVYRDALLAAGFAPVLPDPEMQKAVVHEAVYDPVYGIKAQSRPIDARARNQLLGVIRTLREEGAEAIVLGCTELPLAIPEAELLGMPMIDPTRILARALIRDTRPEKLKPFHR